MDHSLAGIVWAFTRLQIQVEAVIAVMEQQQPDVRQRIHQEMQSLQTQGRLGEIGADYKREVEQVSDWVWMKGQGIDPDSPTT